MARGTYKVVGGDTLWAIAQANNTTVDKLIELNPRYKDNPNLIRPGQTIVLPTKKGAASNWATDFFDSVKDTLNGRKLLKRHNQGPRIGTPIHTQIYGKLITLNFQGLLGPIPKQAKLGALLMELGLAINHLKVVELLE